MKFNPNQLKAIETRNKNVIVSASAGAGKTTLLVERLRRRIIEDKLSINEILAMTFTEKAAAEMKKRLAQSLTYEYEKDPQNLFLKEQLELLPNAQISTIHSFCLSIIKEFGYILSLDPKSISNILDDHQTTEIQLKAKRQTLDDLIHLYHNNSHFIELLDYFNFRVNNYDSFLEFVEKFYKTAQIQLDSDQYYQNISQAYTASNFEEFPSEIKKLILLMMQIVIDEIEASLNIIETDFYESDKQDERFEKWLLSSKQIVNQLQATNDFETMKEIAQQLFYFETIKIKQPYVKMRTELIKGPYNQLAEIVLTSDDLTPLKPYVDLLISSAQTYGKYVTLFKQEAQGFDFDDLEHLAYQLLIHPSQVARTQLQNQYKEIMIDEFQDTNNYQNEIAKLISDGTNIFRVGDVKQSIYGFRNARPEIMMSIIDESDDLSETIYLSNNYRSSYNIVEFSNILFKTMMNITGSSMRYENEDIVSIGLERQKETTHQVEIHLLDDKQILHYKPANTKEFKMIKPKNELRVAYFIAQDIKKKHESGIPFSDMTVLIRTHGRKDSLKRAFEEIGVPYYIEDREGFYSSYSIQDVIHFIRFTYNPHDNIALFWVLQSGFINLTENELSQFALRKSNDSLFNKIKETDNYLYQQLKHLLTELETYDDLQKVLTIVNFNNYYQQHLSTQERTNIDLFIQQINTYLSSPNAGLMGFLKQLEFSQAKTSTAASISELDDVVKVHTIHQSKGLEYPITYFFSFKKDNKSKDSTENIIRDDLGIGLYKPNFDNLSKQNNLFRYALEQKKQIESVQEEIRHLYVALTRAKNQLIIVDTNTTIDEQELSLSHFIKGENYTKLILRSLENNNANVYQLNRDVLIEPIEVLSKKQHHTNKQISSTKIVDPHELIDELSQQEFSLTLNLQAKYATQYGTYLHELIPNLPHRLWSEKELEDIDQSIKNKLITYNQHPFTQELYHYQLQHEVPIAYKKQDAIHYGYMDLLAIKNNEIILVDFKTDKVKDNQELVIRYQSQMLGYYNGLKNAYPTENISIYIYSFELNEYIEVQ